VLAEFVYLNVGSRIDFIVLPLPLRTRRDRSASARRQPCQSSDALAFRCSRGRSFVSKPQNGAETRTPTEDAHEPTVCNPCPHRTVDRPQQSVQYPQGVHAAASLRASNVMNFAMATATILRVRSHAWMEFWTACNRKIAARLMASASSA
jgi:hypothetical protein